MEKLKDFMLLFRMEFNPDVSPSSEELLTIKRAWAEWIGSIARQARLVSSHQLGLEGNTVSAQAEVNTGIFKDVKLAVSGNMVLKAINLEEATEMAQDCPILSVGGSVEIRNTLSTY
jgi:hypothetical protein